MRDLACHRAQGLALVAVTSSLEAVESGCAVEDDQVRAFCELFRISDCFSLFVEIERVLDNDPRGDGFDVQCR